MKKRKEKVGGMALFNGLMLRNKKREAVGRVDNNNNVYVEINERQNNIDEDKFTIYDVPIIRGIISMKNMIASSVPYVLKSSQEILEKKSKEKVEIDKFEVVSAYIISITLILVLVAAIPNFISNFLSVNIRNISQAIMQTCAFVIYLLLLAKIDSLKTLFEYHGAEHKVANAYEKLEKKNITVENVKKYSRFHARCGGNFVVYLFILIIAITMIIPSNNLIFKTIIQVALLPFLAGFSYELIMYTEYLPNFLKFLAYPAMSIQFITTREPSDDKIQLAIYTLFGCINGNKEITINTFIKNYLSYNKKIKKVFEIKDAILIFSSIKDINSNEIFTNMDSITLNYNEQIKANIMLNKLYKDNLPIAYVIGYTNFYKEKYFVNSNVLIPRVDSEILVEKAISYIDNENCNTMLDMCTGSGCLGISIAKNSNIKHVDLIDISAEALLITSKNIKGNGVEDKCNIIKSDLFSKLKDSNIKYDMIVSNPPYINSDVVLTLDESVKKEPVLALDGGKDGMDFYRKILKNAREYLNDKGIIIFEIGYDQLNKIQSEIKKYKEYSIIESIKDYGGNDRVVICRFQKK